MPVQHQPVGGVPESSVDRRRSLNIREAERHLTRRKLRHQPSIAPPTQRRGRHVPISRSHLDRRGRGGHRGVQVCASRGRQARRARHRPGVRGQLQITMICAGRRFASRAPTGQSVAPIRSEDRPAATRRNRRSFVSAALMTSRRLQSRARPNGTSGRCPMSICPRIRGHFETRLPRPYTVVRGDRSLGLAGRGARDREREERRFEDGPDGSRLRGIGRGSRTSRRERLEPVLRGFLVGFRNCRIVALRVVSRR